MGNLFVINKFFICGDICTNDENFTNSSFTIKVFGDTTRVNTCITQIKVEVIKRIRANTDLHNQEDLHG